MIQMQELQRLDSYSIAEVEKIIDEYDEIRMAINRTLPEVPRPSDYDDAAYVVSKEFKTVGKVYEIARLMKAQYYWNGDLENVE